MTVLESEILEMTIASVCAGNKGLAGIISNPVIANGVAGLATSATAQATVERFVLWTLRDTVRFLCAPFCHCLPILFDWTSSCFDMVATNFPFLLTASCSCLPLSLTAL